MSEKQPTEASEAFRQKVQTERIRESIVMANLQAQIDAIKEDLGVRPQVENDTYGAF